jgi:hypothetical protein
MLLLIFESRLMGRCTFRTPEFRSTNDEVIESFDQLTYTGVTHCKCGPVQAHTQRRMLTITSVCIDRLRLEFLSSAEPRVYASFGYTSMSTHVINTPQTNVGSPHPNRTS